MVLGRDEKPIGYMAGIGAGAEGQMLQPPFLRRQKMDEHPELEDETVYVKSTYPSRQRYYVELAAVIPLRFLSDI